MHTALTALGLKDISPGAYGSTVSKSTEGNILESRSPIDGAVLGRVQCATAADLSRIVGESHETFLCWREVPAPKRGELVRQIGNRLRDAKAALGELVTRETGKILQEGLGEIQEAIDIADFAVGLSRQLYGNTMHSERPKHRMYEQWHPLGAVGVITAFNFPAAVWAWNAMLAAVCGDTVIWKPSEFAPLTAIAMNNIAREVAIEHGFPGLFSLVVGDGPELGQQLAADERVPLVSATGSTRMGRSVAEVVARRLGRSLLELGGNNAVIVLKDADLKLVATSTVFGAVGTAGQRCTSTRRLIVERPIAAELTKLLVQGYAQVEIGDPMQAGVLMGPLIHSGAVSAFQSAIARAVSEGGEVLTGGKVLENMPSGFYVEPTIIRAARGMKIVQEETFAPILYIIAVDSLEEAIAVQNEVPQGLSSALFTSTMQSAERYLSVAGSDCGIANVNLGTSGAEIGGAFGGEKETGGGRESGSDSWKAYMRRQTNTINFGSDLPLAQGIRFEIKL